MRISGGLLMFGLLILELTDRVVMKRDLQIAKEIQAWLLPTRPPQVPGLEIAFATRPANTVAGDYYDVFPRRSFDGAAQVHQGELLNRGGRRGGQKHSSGDVDGDNSGEP